MIKKIYNVIQGTILVAVIGVFLVMGTLVIGFDIKPCIVASGSMEPAIPTGSLCMIDGRDCDAVKGDVIAYRTGEMTVTHRVIQVRDSEHGGGYVTKGDNNDTVDPGVVRPFQVLGTCIWTVPHAGYAVMWLQSPLGMLAALLVIFGLGITGWLLQDERA